MFGSERYVDKWKPILEHQDLPEISDPYRRAITTVMLENQEKANREIAEQYSGGGSFLTETAANATGANISNWDPVLISLVRRAMPNLIAYDIIGVQPMSGPTGLVFAMRSKYTSQGGTEALFNEAQSQFSGIGAHTGDSSSLNNAAVTLNAATATNANTFSYDAVSGTLNVGDELWTSQDSTGVLVGTVATVGDDSGTDGTFTANASVVVGDNGVLYARTIGRPMSTAAGESLGNTGDDFAEMAFSIDKTSVTAKTRALKAEYTMELSQDLKAIHGLDAEAELGNIISAEILAEINREIIRTVNTKAQLGCQQAGINSAGTYNLHEDSDGRWHNERYKGMLIHLEREANQIAKDTRRGKGNFVLCSSDVATALASTGAMNYATHLSTDLNVDDTGNTFAGVLNGKMKVYIDPYSTIDYVTVGYRGTSPYDAGLFYCPYVPLVMVRAVGEEDFQPRIGFKTRYGMIANPFAQGTTKLAENAGIAADRANVYYRIFGISNLLSNE